MNNVYCSQCGFKVDKNSSFCSKCGHRLSVNDAEIPVNSKGSYLKNPRLIHLPFVNDRLRLFISTGLLLLGFFFPWRSIVQGPPERWGDGSIHYYPIDHYANGFDVFLEFFRQIQYTFTRKEGSGLTSTVPVNDYEYTLTSFVDLLFTFSVYLFVLIFLISWIISLKVGKLKVPNLHNLGILYMTYVIIYFIISSIIIIENWSLNLEPEMVIRHWITESFAAKKGYWISALAGLGLFRRYWIRDNINRCVGFLGIRFE
jgi:hypothetical protein